jgi:hypothetical protein
LETCEPFVSQEQTVFEYIHAIPKNAVSRFAVTVEGCNPAHMETPLTAQDLWPLLLKLPHDEQVRLAKLALHAAAGGGRADVRAYQSAPPAADEFSVTDDPMAWEGEGWDEY